MIILIDSREKTPYTFDFAPLVKVVLGQTLKTGDYTLQGFEDQVIVERKSLVDLFGSCGRNRRRFEAELARMADFKHAAVVIESEWSIVLRHPPTRSKLNPKTILYSVIAWEQRYGVFFWMCPNRSAGERITFRILQRYYNDHEGEVLK